MPDSKGRTGYAAKKAFASELSLKISAEGREIGSIPPVLKPRRKAGARRDFQKFCRTYFPQTFNLPWSNDHIAVIRQIETSVLSGGLFATAMPRGMGKTSLCEKASIWAILYGHRDFIALIGGDESLAVQMLDSIKTEFEVNTLLLEDFPEAIYPIVKLEGISHRCLGQICAGKRTHIGWSADEVVMPTIEGSKASGAVIRVKGLGGGIRGMKYSRRDGQTVRPSLVILDDPQTDQSARSPSQCATRERILAGAILGLAGPGKKISGIMPCTVISIGDMADNILNRDKHPAWHGIRTKMVYSFPVNEKLWEEYGRLRRESLKAGSGGKEATEFYKANRQAMDEGAIVAWEACYEPDELSAIQHAMNLKIDRERAFFSEYQNEPMAEEESRPDDLTPDQIVAKLNRIPRGLVAIGANRLTAMIDVQGSMLFYVVTAWEDDFTGYVVDWGSFPDQKRDYYTLANAKIKLEHVVKGAGLEGQIYGGLKLLAADILGREWLRDDGAAMHIERCLIDANWGVSTQVVYKFCRESEYASILTPSHGLGIGASGKPMSEWQKQQGDRLGINWRLRNMEAQRAVRGVLYDTNFWKSFLMARLGTAMGDRGTLTLFGDKQDEQRLLADHLCAEYRIRTHGRGREIDEFKLRPERPDNHLFDALVGCCVAASMQGVVLPQTQAASVARPKRLSFTEIQRRAREQRNQPPGQPRA